MQKELVTVTDITVRCVSRPILNLKTAIFAPFAKESASARDVSETRRFSN